MPRIKSIKAFRRDRMVTLDDEKRLLASCPRPLKDVLIIMLDSGLRNGEVIPLFTHVCSLPSKVLDLPVQLCVPTRSVVTAKLILACSVMWIPKHAALREKHCSSQFMQQWSTVTQVLTS